MGFPSTGLTRTAPRSYTMSGKRLVAATCVQAAPGVTGRFQKPRTRPGNARYDWQCGSTPADEMASDSWLLDYFTSTHKHKNKGNKNGSSPFRKAQHASVSVLYVYFGNEKGFRLQCSVTVADKAKQNVIVKFKEIISKYILNYLITIT